MVVDRAGDHACQCASPTDNLSSVIGARHGERRSAGGKQQLRDSPQTKPTGPRLRPVSWPRDAPLLRRDPRERPVANTNGHSSASRASERRPDECGSGRRDVSCARGPALGDAMAQRRQQPAERGDRTVGVGHPDLDVVQRSVCWAGHAATTSGEGLSGLFTVVSNMVAGSSWKPLHASRLRTDGRGRAERPVPEWSGSPRR